MEDSPTEESQTSQQDGTGRQLKWLTSARSRNPAKTFRNFKKLKTCLGQDKTTMEEAEVLEVTSETTEQTWRKNQTTGWSNDGLTATEELEKSFLPHRRCL